MNDIKFFAFLIPLFIASCSINKLEEKNERKSNIEYLYPIMNRYFEKFDFKTIDDYKYSTVYNSFYAVQVDINKMNYNNIKDLNDKLLEDGWYVVKTDQSLSQYCYGRNLFMEVIAPIEIAGNISGEIAMPLDHEWNLALSWRHKGKDKCSQLPVKDLKALN